MRSYKYIVFTAGMLLLSACASWENITQEQNKAAAIPHKVQKTEPEIIDCIEVQGCNVTLQADAAGTYEIVVENEEGEIIQQFPCDAGPGQLRLAKAHFRYYLYNDLAVVYTEEADRDKPGYLYCWDWKEQRFFEEAIKIPCGYEFSAEHSGYFTVTKKDGLETETAIYTVETNLDEAVKLRIWKYDGNTGNLKIEDCIAETLLFDGMAKKDNEGNLIAEEYYLDIFWRDLSHMWIWDTPAEDSFYHIWSQWTSPEAEYQDRESMLRACGFEDTEPFYLYYDTAGRLRLELYLDEESGTGCAIDHSFYYTPEHTPVDSMTGFLFEKNGSKDWNGAENPYSITDYDGAGADSVDDYEVIVEYTEDGRLDYFHSQGIIDWLRDKPGLYDILKVNLIYREDGSLAHRIYHHNPMIFSSTSSTVNSSYDEAERLVHESSYITHGSLEEYYIYTDDSAKPAYCLSLDWGGGGPVFISYR